MEESKNSAIPDHFISINIWLADRSYRIKIDPQDEEKVRKAVKNADEKIKEFRQNYAGKDDQDFMAMCLLLYATQSMKEIEKEVWKDEIKSMINRIDKVLEIK